MKALCGLLSLASVFSCTLPVPVPAQALGESRVRLRVSPSDAVKSAFYSDEDLVRLNNVTVYGVDESGYWKKAYYVSADGITAGGIMSFPQGKAVDFYVLGNMGEVNVPRGEDGRPDFAAFIYHLPTDGNLTESGFPMASKAHFGAEDLETGEALPIRLEPLFAKVEVSIDKRGLSGNVTAPVLLSQQLHLRRGNRRLCPFSQSGSLPLDEDDLFDAPFDSHYFLAAEGSGMEHSSLALYVPENRQTGNDALGTYLEYAGEKNGSTDGVNGPLVYRGAMGPIQRNSLYHAILNLSWRKLMWEADGWRIDASGVSDLRRLRFLDADGNETNYLKVNRQRSANVYAYFSIDDDQGEGTVGRKDQASYPYGWTLSFDGEPLTGHDGAGDSYDPATGISVQCLGNAVVGGKNATRICISASTEATVTISDASLRHSLRLQTTDEICSATPLQLDIEDLPFLFEWAAGTPDHVGQSGILRCIDPYTGNVASGAVFHLKEGYGTLSPFTDNGDGTAQVQLLNPFASVADAISITDADGRRQCDIALEARLPYFECSNLWTTYVDAGVDLKFSYFAVNADGSKSSRLLAVTDPSDAAFTGNGNQLNKVVVEARIAPSLEGMSGKLGFTPILDQDGCYLLNTYIATYEGITPTGTSFYVDDALVSMAHFPERGTHSTPFTAWNPWKNIGSIRYGHVLDDYTLYRRPSASSGWIANPPAAPDASAAYTLQIQNPVVADEANITYDARFLYGYSQGSGYIGSICSGTPNKTAADYAADKWTLEMRVTQYMFDWERTRAYLNQSFGYNFQSNLELLNYLAYNDFRIVLSNNYDSEADALAASPDTIYGTTFTARRNSEYETWTMTYTMAGKTDANMNNVHGAGPIEVYMQVKNPHGNSWLRKSVAQIYMRLHAYIFPMCYSEKATQDGTFQVSCYFANGSCPYLTQTYLGGVLDKHEFTVYTANWAYVSNNGSAGNAPWAPDRLSGYYQLTCQAVYPERIANRNMKGYVLYNPSTSSGIPADTRYQPFIFSATQTEGQGNYYRENETTAYFDPVGSPYGPFQNPEDREHENQKLFVLHVIPEWYWMY